MAIATLGHTQPARLALRLLSLSEEADAQARALHPGVEESALPQLHAIQLLRDRRGNILGHVLCYSDGTRLYRVGNDKLLRPTDKGRGLVAVRFCFERHVATYEYHVPAGNDWRRTRAPRGHAATGLPP